MRKENRIMAQRLTYWLGGDGDPTNASNWSNGAPWDITDECMAIVDGSISNVDMLGGDLTQNATQSTSWFRVFRSYTGNIGSSGNNLKLAVASGTATSTNRPKDIVLRGTGTMYIENDPGNWGPVIVDVPLGSNRVYLDGAYSHVLTKSGHVIYASTIAVSTETGTYSPGAYVEIPSGVSAGKIIHCGSGVIIDASGGGTAAEYDIVVDGGRLHENGVFGSFTNIFVGGGIFEYAPESDPSAYAPDLLATSGLVDISEARFPLDWGNLIIGPAVEWRGPSSNPRATGGTLIIDLGEDYP
jgi:hypothetical protein